jgi:hypothetical protein
MTIGGVDKDEKDQPGTLSQRRAFSRFGAIILICASIIVVCAIVGWFVIDWYSRCREIEYTSPQEIEDFAHIKFSPSATNAMMYSPDLCTSPRHFFVRFQLDPGDLNSFVASTRVPALQSQTAKLTRFEPLPARLDWHLDSVTLVGSGPISLDYEQVIGVDITDPKRYTVYLVVTSYD